LYPTLEFRCCDVNTKVDEAVCIAALLQAVVAKMWKLRRDNMTFRVYAADLIEENKWRAVRYGLGGKLIDFGKKEEMPASVLIRELIEWFLDDVLDELGTRREVEYAFRIMEEGSSAQRQLATYARTGDLRAVVDQIIRETAEGVCEPTLGPALDGQGSMSAQPATGPTPTTGLPAVRGQSVP
jgi:carboxylate-amine ligase